MHTKKKVFTPTTHNRRGILLVAFGSSTPVGNTTLAGFENYVRQRFPQTSIRWAFTSSHMRSRLTKARKKIDSVEKALKRMQFEKMGHIVVQPLHIIPGVEFDNLRQEIANMAQKSGIAISLGKPLLFNKKSIAKAADALLFHLPKERLPSEPIICMGHGSWHRGSLGYAAFNRAIAEKDPCVFIGTLEGRQTLDTIIKKLRKVYPPYEMSAESHTPTFLDAPQNSSQPSPQSPSTGVPLALNTPPALDTSLNAVEQKNSLQRPKSGEDIENKKKKSPHPFHKRVWLLPLLSVIGHHALHDMAGEISSSWKSQLESAGYECMTVLKGTAEYEKFIEIWTEHIQEVM